MRARVHVSVRVSVCVCARVRARACVRWRVQATATRRVPTCGQIHAGAMSRRGIELPPPKSSPHRMRGAITLKGFDWPFRTLNCRRRKRVCVWGCWHKCVHKRGWYRPGVTGRTCGGFVSYGPASRAHPTLDLLQQLPASPAAANICDDTNRGG